MYPILSNGLIAQLMPGIEPSASSDATRTFALSWLIIIQHIDTLPKHGHKTLDVRRST